MKVLAIDTSTDRASLALRVDRVTVWQREFGSRQSHSTELFPALEEAIGLADGYVGCIAVGLGPGSYAGVRIGIAAAQGMALVMGCALVGLPSVLALGGGELSSLGGDKGEDFQVIGDARREAWYYSRVQNGECVEGPSLVESADVLRELLKGREEVVVATDSLEGWDVTVRLPRAEILAMLAENGRGIVQRGNLEPLYLREVHITLPKEK